MATRSTIAIEHEDGTVSQIYCHWDGYISNNGKILYHHYNTVKKAKALVEAGYLSSLNVSLSSCVHKHYDVADNFNSVADNFNSLDAYFKDGRVEEFNYIFRKDEDGSYKWFVKSYENDNVWCLLEESFQHKS